MPTDQELKLKACDDIETLITMLRQRKFKHHLTPEEVETINTIEDFATNYLGED